MKQLLIIAVLFVAFSTAKAQNTKIDTNKYHDQPNRIYEWTFKGTIQDLNLLKFAVQGAPLMETTIPANQVKSMGVKLNKWLTSIDSTYLADHKTDSIKYFKKP